jgi:hypothetical protein
MGAEILEIAGVLFVMRLSHEDAAPRKAIHM